MAEDGAAPPAAARARVAARRALPRRVTVLPAQAATAGMMQLPRAGAGLVGIRSRRLVWVSRIGGCLRAMEGLPSDAILTILLKLAAHDPLSLLRATLACKWILELTEKDPAVWREAFLKPYQRDTGDVRSEGIADLDAQIPLQGGYKKLALAKWQATKLEGFRTNREQTRSLLEQIMQRFLLNGKRILRYSGALKPTRSVKVYGARYLYLIRLRGRLLCAAENAPDEILCCEQDPNSVPTDDTSVALDFAVTESTQKLLGATYDEMIQDWGEVKTGADGICLVDDKISLEVYVFVTIPEPVFNFPSAYLPMYSNSIITVQDCEGVEYQFPECRVPAYFVPLGTHGFSGKGGQSEDASSAEAESIVFHTST